MHTGDVRFDLTDECALCILPLMTRELSLKALRSARGWTQQDAATYFGVDKATVWRWENEGLPSRGPSRRLIEREMSGGSAEATEPEAGAA